MAPNFTPNELVWYEKDGQIHSSGYKVESLFKTLGIAPMTTMNEQMSGGCGSGVVGDKSIGSDGGQFSDLFRFMGVPAGLSAIISENVVGDNDVMTGGRKSAKSGDDFDIQRVEKGLVPSSLFERLTALASPDSDNNVVNETETKAKSTSSQKKRVTRRLHLKESNKSGKKRTTRRNRRR